MDMEMQGGGIHCSSTQISPCLPKQLLPKSDICILPHSDQMEMDIEAGSVYEIDHSKLPPKTPLHLRSIRAVMVNEKTEKNLTVMFPSSLSLKTFLDDDKLGLMQPDLDNKYTMGLCLARDVLSNKITFQEFAARRGTQTFWVLSSKLEESSGALDDDNDIKNHQKNEKGTPLIDTKWGKRRKFTSTRRQREKNSPISRCKIERENDDDDDDDAEDVKNVKREDDEEEAVTGRVNKKRKRGCDVVMYERRKRGSKSMAQAPSKFISPKHRWTTERYGLAEKHMLKIMKTKGAIYGNPILRPELRSEARKLIGDTGLLDHLLKHMAGKLAPGGEHRFRRKHNPEGAMEYWLESANLENIRKQVGVDDPYWTPPPGWRPGDCPTQDPICAREIKNIKKELAVLKREIKEFASIKQDNSRALVTFPTASDAQLSLLKFPKETYEVLLKMKAHMEEKLLEWSKILIEMEEELGSMRKEKKETATVTVLREENGKRIPAFTKAAIVPALASFKDKAEGTKTSPASPHDRHKQTPTTIAARRHRLKSAFRVCKPPGTFLWPDMAPSPSSSTTASSSHAALVRLNDLLEIPSSPSSPLQHRQLPSPVKPVAKKASLNLTISSDNASPTSNVTAHSFVPDLNEAPLSSSTCQSNP